MFLSNGPGDPSAVATVPATVADLLGEVPVFGICMGHQILGTALGASTYKLPFGHHGGNHPVRDLDTGKVEITSQNHNYCVDLDARQRGPRSPTATSTTAPSKDSPATRSQRSRSSTTRRPDRDPTTAATSSNDSPT